MYIPSVKILHGATLTKNTPISHLYGPTLKYDYSVPYPEHQNISIQILLK